MVQIFPRLQGDGGGPGQLLHAVERAGVFQRTGVKGAEIEEDALVDQLGHREGAALGNIQGAALGDGEGLSQGEGIAVNLALVACKDQALPAVLAGFILNVFGKHHPAAGKGKAAGAYQVAAEGAAADARIAGVCRSGGGEGAGAPAWFAPAKLSAGVFFGGRRAAKPFFKPRIAHKERNFHRVY